jgi:hypothetical protein
MYHDRLAPVRDLGEARSLLGDIDSQILRTVGTTTDADADAAPPAAIRPRSMR